jgi:hypothetical protein
VTRDAIRPLALVDSRPSTCEEILDAMLAARPAWHAHAACRDQGLTDTFFPTGWAGRTTSYHQALALCDGCAVAGPCAEQGRTEPGGVWGGQVRDKNKSAGRTTLALLRREGGWWTARRIAQARRVTERTVYRQLGALRADGLVEQDKQDTGPTLYRATTKGRA